MMPSKTILKPFLVSPFANKGEILSLKNRSSSARSKKTIDSNSPHHRHGTRSNDRRMSRGVGLKVRIDDERIKVPKDMLQTTLQIPRRRRPRLHEPTEQRSNNLNRDFQEV